jgi:hypothetical protein
VVQDGAVVSASSGKEALVSGGGLGEVASGAACPFSPAAHGELVSRYFRPSSEGEWEHCIFRWSLAENAAVCSLHRRLEVFALWMIDAASPIDVEDDKWVVFASFRRNAVSNAVVSGVWELVGYTTVFRFYNPMRKSRPLGLRLAQQVCMVALCIGPPSLQGVYVL